MKRTFLITTFLFVFIATNAQRIKYESSYPVAKQKSATSGKPLFLHLHWAPIKMPLAPGLDMPEVVEFYNKNFINYLSLRPEPSVQTLMNELNVNSFPTYLFFDKDENLLHRATRSSSNSSRYLLMGDSVMRMAVSDESLASYKQKHKAGLLGHGGLKEYIVLRENLGYRDNADLIEDYVNTLSVKSLGDYDTVLFILSAGPYAYGKAFKIAHINQKIIDSIYKTEPLDRRIDINNRIIGNTYNKAVKLKDAKMAEAAAGFARGTWSKNYREAYNTYELKMLSFYKATNDTARYLPRAMYFYDNYSRLPIDSIKKYDEGKRREAIQQTSRIANAQPMYESSSLQSAVVSESSIVMSPVQSIASVLNNAAYEVYLTKTNNPRYLDKAIKWSEKSLELNPSPATYDTLAHLLYRKGLFNQAEEAQQKAVMLSQKNAPPGYNKSMQAELKKIKARKL